MSKEREKVLATTQQRQQLSVMFKILAAGLSWGFSWKAVSHGIATGWLPAGLPTIAAILLITGLGVIYVFVAIDHLRQIDDLLRKVNLVAYSFCAAVALISITTFMLFQQTGITTLMAFGLGHVVLLIFITYPTVVLIELRRHT